MVAGLPYRTAFHTGLPFREAHERTEQELCKWLRGKRYDIAAYENEQQDLAPDAHMRYVSMTGTRGWQLRERTAIGTWLTTLTVHEESPSRSWISLDVEHVPFPGYEPQRAAVPRLARLLLEEFDAYDDEAVLRPEPELIRPDRVENLLELVCAPDRRLPVVVAAPHQCRPFDDWRHEVARLTADLPGLASVYILDPTALTEFNGGMGDGPHHVGPGAVRTYLAETDPAVADDALRHRVLSGRRIEADPARARQVLGLLPRQLAANRPRPGALAKVTFARQRTSPESRSPEAELAGLRVRYLDLEHLLKETEWERDRAKDQRDDLDSRLFDAHGELEAEQRRRSRLADRVRYLERLLCDSGHGDQVYTESSYADPPKSFDELLDRIGELPRIVFTGDRHKALSLDDQHEYSTWAVGAWDALRALSDYADAKADGTFTRGFYAWCKEPPSGALAITARKVVRAESDTVCHSAKFSGYRMLPCPVTIDPSGRVFMGAHIRIGASGRVSPRMHFHDAVAADGNVYIGYIGPHLPNTLTN